MELSIGQLLGDYEILGVLGAGGMGKVYKVRNKISGRVEAMKILLPDLNAAPELVDRFLREIRISGSLDHPNIAGMRTAQRIDNQLVMVMEFVEGSTLEALMKQGKIPIDKGIDCMRQALSALKYAHAQGVVHRDIKPGNMMLTPSGTLKLMDFGIAKMASDTKLTKTGLMVGSVYYMSPEQIEGKDLDGRSDLYSLGITLYQLATGKRPFDGESEYQIMAAHLKESPLPPRELDPSVPAELDDIIMLAMARDPNQRFQTAEAFQNALAATVPQPKPQPAPQTQPLPQPQPQPHVPVAAPAVIAPQRSPRLLYMLTGSAATLAVIVAGIIEIPKYMHTGAASRPDTHQSPPPTQPPAQTNPSPPPPVTQPPTQQPPTQTPPDPNNGQPPSGPVARHPQSSPPASPTKTTTNPPGSTPPPDPRQPTANPQPQPPPQQQSPPPAKTTPPANSAELDDLRERANLMMVRVGTIRTAFENLQRQQAASGLSPRSDMVASDQRLNYQFGEAENSLRAGDPVQAKKRLDAAEHELEKLESFLGK